MSSVDEKLAECLLLAPEWRPLLCAVAEAKHSPTLSRQANGVWRLDFVPGYGLQGSDLLRLLPQGFSHADQSAIWMRDASGEEVETEWESTTLRHAPLHAQLSVGEHIFAGVEATLTLCPSLRTWMEEIEFPDR